MRALTIGELESESGVPRRTIYYYVRQGLLPEAQKARRTRALYTEDHLALLGEIEGLRARGLRPAAIRERLAGRLRVAGESEVDLVARRDEEVREAILAAATRRFARKGYKGTRMADLVTELGITPQLLYQHFATKRELFVACYRIAVRYMNPVVRHRVEPEGDPGARLLWYMFADEGIKAFAPHMFALAVEASQHDESARRDLREAYEMIFRDLIDDLLRLRTSVSEPPISDELISHGMMGAFQQMLARAALDDEYSWREVTRHTLGLFLLLLTAYRGEQDLGAKLAPYEDLLTEVAELPPPVPPELRP
ncbi:MAG TPA: TetR family transcriptional regulator [Thermoleophilia bacterium]|nr:TetR family transcriptional regulator [Thermoleophilia bacterium]